MEGQKFFKTCDNSFINQTHGTVQHAGVCWLAGFICVSVYACVSVRYCGGMCLDPATQPDSKGISSYTICTLLINNKHTHSHKYCRVRQSGATKTFTDIPDRNTDVGGSEDETCMSLT